MDTQSSLSLSSITDRVGQMLDSFNTAAIPVTNRLDPVLDNKFVSAILIILIIVYLAKLRLGVPTYIRSLFKNDIFRVVFLSLLLIYNFHNAPHVAILVAIFFVVTLHYIGEEETREQFAYLEAFAVQKVQAKAVVKKTPEVHVQEHKQEHKQEQKQKTVQNNCYCKCDWDDKPHVHPQEHKQEVHSVVSAPVVKH